MSKEQILTYVRGESEAESLAEPFSVRQPERGRVSLVGAGPGAVDLLTIRGQRILAQADVVVYDDLANAELLDFCPDEARRIYVGKRGGRRSLPQEQITQILVSEALKGLHVVRLKGGDPLVFGRGGEEIAVLAEAGISYEIVPGVTAAVAAGASIGVPLTHRKHASAVVFVTGHECVGKGPERAGVNWPALAASGATLCIYMGVRRLGEIVGKLIDGGAQGSTPVAIVANATLRSQEVHTTTLAEAVLYAERLKGKPSLIIVGEVAALAESPSGSASLLGATGPRSGFWPLPTEGSPQFLDALAS